MINSRKLLAGFVSISALAMAGACSSGASGGLDFGGGGSGSGGFGAAPGSGAAGGGGGGTTVADNSGGDGGAAPAGDGGGASTAGSGDGASTAGSGDAENADTADAEGAAGADDDEDDTDDGAATVASTGALQRVVDGPAEPIVTAGNALLPGATPINDAADDADGTLNPAARVVVSNQPVLGSGDGSGMQLAGVSALSQSSASGDVLTANVGENGELINLELMADPLLASAQEAAGDGTGAASDALNGQEALTLALGGATVGGATPAIGAAVLSPTQPTGSIATAGLASGGQTATLGLAGNSLTGQAGSALQGIAPGGLNATLGSGGQTLVGAGAGSTNPPQGTLASAGVLSTDPLSLDVNGASLTGGNQLLSGQVDTLAVGGTPALIGVGALSATQPQGSAATVGAASGGQTATLGLSAAR